MRLREGTTCGFEVWMRPVESEVPNQNEGDVDDELEFYPSLSHRQESDVVS